MQNHVDSFSSFQVKKSAMKRGELWGEKTTLPVRKQSVQHEKVDLGALSTAYQAHCRAL